MIKYLYTVQIKVDSTIESLDAVLNEQANFSVFFFEKFEKLLPYDEVVISLVFCAHLLEL